MTLPYNTLFNQRDVRETPASTATATAVGLTGEPYVLVSAGGTDLTAERVLTAGTGVNITDQGAGTTVTIASNDGAIIHDNLSGFVANEHLDWTIDQGATNIHSGNYTDTNTTYTANETNITLSGTEFQLKNKTSYWSCLGSGFRDIDRAGGSSASWVSGGDAHIAMISNNVLQASVNLPHNAIVTGVIVYGSDTGETWTLYRRQIDTQGIGTAMASAAIDTEDTTITNATIDNSTYAYVIETSPLDAADDIDGARITYTTDYI